MDRIVLCCNSTLGLPTIGDLVVNGQVVGLVIPELAHPANWEIEQLAQAQDLPLHVARRRDFERAFGAWLREIRPQVVLTLTFPYRVPASLLGLPERGFFNFHFGLLPRYRGPDPIFWQIRNGEPSGAISVHRMDEGLDTGPLLASHPLPLLPGETYGMHVARLAAAAPAVAREALALLEAEAAPKLRAQEEREARFWPRPGPADWEVDWAREGAEGVERLVNACNPVYPGATTSLRGAPLRLREVAPVDAPDRTELPGTLVHADPGDGLFVACCDGRCLRLNVVETAEGLMTGFKLAALGVRAGERLGREDQLKTI